MTRLLVVAVDGGGSVCLLHGRRGDVKAPRRVCLVIDTSFDGLSALRGDDGRQCDVFLLLGEDGLGDMDGRRIAVGLVRAVTSLSLRHPPAAQGCPASVPSNYLQLTTIRLII